MLSGLVLTIELTVLSILCGTLLAIPLAVLRVSTLPVFWMPVYGYTFFFRGTPLLVQIFLIYYGSGQFRGVLQDLGLWALFREPYFCAVLTLALNTAAYIVEILRGGIQAVPTGQIEAGLACGMSRSRLYQRVIFPQAFRFALPAFSNEVIFLFQSTSLVSIITLLDLTGVARIIAARTLDVYEIYLTACLLYLGITYTIVGAFRFFEVRLSGHLRGSSGGSEAHDKQAIVLRG